MKRTYQSHMFNNRCEYIIDFQKEASTKDRFYMGKMITPTITALDNSGVTNYQNFYQLFKRIGIKSKEISVIINEFKDYINSFEQNRQNGENDTYLSELIRNDSISEFISFVHQYNLLLSSKLRPSIFEMNPLLNEREPTLIEYAAFYGSIQIFNYLKDNDVTLEPSLWIYIIHSNNAELFYFLEEKQIRPPQN